ncbi:MAG: beta-L-arabinofuranosidase domain-containing protein [Limnochordia bacterium]
MLYDVDITVERLIGMPYPEHGGTTFMLTKTLTASEQSSCYASNKEPLKRLPLIRLPLDSIRPLGWLKRQLDLMVDGLTGRLPEFGKFFQRDWNGWLYPETDKGWEEVPYWFRGFYPLAAITGDQRLLQIAHKYIDALINSQDEEGYFGPRYLKCMVGKNGQRVCDLLPHMTILSPMIQHYEYTQDQRVLPFLQRFFTFCANLSDEMFVPLQPEGNFGWGGGKFGKMAPFCQSLRAGDMLPHLIWFYNQTGAPRILKLAKRFFEHIRPPWDEWLDHHAVNFAQRFAYPAIYSQISHLEYHLKKSEYWYNQMMMTWGQMPRGILAADERIRPGCVDPRQAFETCGMVEFCNNFYELGRITGDPIYAKRCEDIMLNHFPVTYSRDNKALHYLTAANMPQLDISLHHHFRNGLKADRSMVIYTPHNRCCGHNYGMGWPFYVQNLWQATADNGLALWLYAACEVTANVGGACRPVNLSVETDYPFRSDVRITCRLEHETVFPMYLRIPEWCLQYVVKVNGVEAYRTSENSTYLQVKRLWRDGDLVEITMAMHTSVTQWPRNGSVTIDRGPLSYSVKIGEEWRKHLDIGNKTYEGTEEWPNWEVLPTTPWNYGLVLDIDNVEASTIVLERDVTDQPWSVESAPIEIQVKAKRIPEWILQDETVAELQESPVYTDTEEETITLIPLGCARLRMSCLPLVSDDPETSRWQTPPAHIPIKDRPTNRFDDMYPMGRPKKANEDL